MRVLAVLLAAAMACSAGEALNYSLLAETQLQARLRLAHKKNPERYQRLKTLFTDAGCQGDLYREQAVKGSKQPNMICDLAGTGDSRRKIIVGAHFDAVGGDGVIDNWSGAVLLPTLFEMLRRAGHRHTIEFVGFAGEEKGLLGSKVFVKSLSGTERDSIAAMIGLDSLGLTPTKCWVYGSTPGLVNMAQAVAQSMHLEFSGVNVEKVGSSDSQVFKDANIPVLSLHSVTQETWQTINGPRDVWAAVSWKDYYDSYKLITVVIEYLDKTLP